MFCAIKEWIGHRGTEAQRAQRREAGKSFLRLSLCLCALCGPSLLSAERFTKLDVALHHLTLLDLFSDSTKRSHRVSLPLAGGGFTRWRCRRGCGGPACH